MMKKLVVCLIIIIGLTEITTTFENTSDNSKFVRDDLDSGDSSEESSEEPGNFCNQFDVIIFDKNLNETAVDVEVLDSVDFLSKKIKRHASELPNDYQRSLLLIFDGTGSMFKELEKLRRAAKEIIAELSSFQDNPIFNYVLVIFRDPSK
jgi:hypothetical protein